ncbi:MAG: pyroglutamyl-peptidase I [Clostridia bacterium]|nr:pyroglutamyl-peptidase I [Clostridia bacterium]
MKKLLITGFEPFGGETRNPSWDAVALLPNQVGMFALTKLCIPVVFRDAARSVIETAEQLRPDVILCIGQAGGRDAVTPEFVGINLMHAGMPDNAGNQPADEPIAAEGSAAYFATVPARQMIEVIRAAGVAAKPSYSAGTYVCNDVLYSLLARYSGTDTRVGFIHVPFAPEQAKAGVPSMALGDMVTALTAAIGALE